MSRSVSVPRNTVFVSYQSIADDQFYCMDCGETFDKFGHLDGDEVCPHCASSKDNCYREDGSENFRDNINYARDQIIAAFPSVTKEDKWIDREDHAFASNNFAYFGVSEYCGLVAVWVSLKECDQPGLRDKWVSTIEKKFRKAADGTFGITLVKLSTFSNGEAIFRAAEPKQTKGELGIGFTSKEGWL